MSIRKKPENQDVDVLQKHAKTVRHCGSDVRLEVGSDIGLDVILDVGSEVGWDVRSDVGPNVYNLIVLLAPKEKNWGAIYLEEQNRAR